MAVLNEVLSVESASGSIASFETDMTEDLVSAIFSFEPIQEGSGDPSPSNVRAISGWNSVRVTRCGKNLFDANTVIGGYINASGVVTPDLSSWHSPLIPVNSGEKYTFSGSTSGRATGTGNKRLHGYNSNGVWVRQFDYVSVPAYTKIDYSITVTIPTDIKFVAISFLRDDTNVMLAQEETATDYESYNGSKIPITFPAVGKNLYDSVTYPITEGGWISPNGGHSVSSENFSYTDDFIPFSGYDGQTITLNKSPGGMNPSIAFYSSDNINSFISGIQNNNQTAGTPISYVVPNGTKYIRFTVPAGATDIQLELGSTATAYEPYNNTLYGGYVDLVRGELVATKGIIKASQFNFNNFAKSSSYENKYVLWLPGITRGDAQKIYAISDKMEGVSAYTFWRENSKYICSGNVSSSTYLRFSFPTTESIDTVEKAREWLTTNDPTFVYDLNTPITYPLTPVQIQTLVGRNNIWSDANGTASVRYYKHADGTVESVKANPLWLRRNIIIGSPRLVTVRTGNTQDSTEIANFRCNMTRNIRSLKVHFEPKQEGSGDPSPSNVRAITGWDSVNVTCAGKNLLRINGRYTSDPYTIPDTDLTVTNIQDEDGNTYGLNVTGSFSGSNRFYNLNVGGPYNKYYNFKSGIYKAYGEQTGIGIRAYGIDENGEHRILTEFTGNSFEILQSYYNSNTRIQILNDFVNGDVDVFPMVTLASETDLTFESFKPRIKTISFKRAGKNLVAPLEYWNDCRYSSSLIYYFDSSSMLQRTTYNIPVKENTTYTFSYSYSEEPSGVKYVSIFYFGENDKYLSSETKEGTAVTFTTPANTVYIKISFRTFGMASNVQLEEGSTVTAYEPFDNVIYGGYVDLVKGELVATHGIVTLTGTEANGSYNWNSYTVQNTILRGSNDTITCKMCSHTGNMIRGSVMWENYQNHNNVVSITQGNHIRYRDRSVGSTLEEYQTYLQQQYANGTPVQVCGELVTPIIYHIDPVQIPTLKGVNNIWSDSNSYTEIQYLDH